jgi:hypothetical protein
MTQFAGENAAAFRTEYGNISAASSGAIQRGLVALEEQGADAFFGEPARHYEKTVDRESAYEKLKAKAEAQQAEEAPTSKQKGRAEPQSDTSKIFGAMAMSAAHAIGSRIGRQIIRGVLGSILGSGKRR